MCAGYPQIGKKDSCQVSLILNIRISFYKINLLGWQWWPIDYREKGSTLWINRYGQVSLKIIKDLFHNVQF